MAQFQPIGCNDSCFAIDSAEWGVAAWPRTMQVRAGGLSDATEKQLEILERSWRVTDWDSRWPNVGIRGKTASELSS